MVLGGRVRTMVRPKMAREVQSGPLAQAWVRARDSETSLRRSKTRRSLKARRARSRRMLRSQRCQKMAKRILPRKLVLILMQKPRLFPRTRRKVKSPLTKRMNLITIASSVMSTSVQVGHWMTSCGTVMMMIRTRKIPRRKRRMGRSRRRILRPTVLREKARQKRWRQTMERKMRKMMRTTKVKKQRSLKQKTKKMTKRQMQIPSSRSAPRNLWRKEKKKSRMPSLM
mmetsp:Transcript_25314/g.46583  ORF Transcript_25314/g.46583 Transcript_25314/m.46583 type:complete len:227 (+) Transcript_25314:719-1399(+)